MQKNQLNFICKRCTECCRVFRLPVKNNEELIKAFEKQMGFKLKSYDMEVIVKGECEHLQGRDCLTQDFKPKRCEEYMCQRHVDSDVPAGQIYQKRCLVCGNMRKFQAGKERDKQSICGNCWVW